MITAKSDGRNINVFIFGFITIIILMIITIFNYEFAGKYAEEYLFVTVSMFVYLIYNFFLFSFGKFYIFEPISLVFLLYLFIFFIDPLINIITNNTACMGYEVMSGCKKTTWIFVVSYIAFTIGYYSKKKIIFSFGQNVNNINWENSARSIELYATVIWVLSFVFGCIELVSKGMSMSYFLTLGLTGEIENMYATSAFGFLGNFRFSMISAWLYLFVCNRRSLKTKVCGLLTLEYFILRGFRHSLFVLIFSPIIYAYVRERKKPRARVLVLLFTITVIVMGIMQFARGALRSGGSVDWSTFDMSIFVEAIQGNCDVYKTFYGMVEVVPKRLEYQWGKECIVSVVTMIVPRSIWPSKPIAPIITNLHMFCGALAADSGYAMPNISEYYLDFGIVGCIIGLYLFGIVLKRMKYLYIEKRASNHSLILYSVMFPALLQVVLRGYSPSYLYLLLFYAFPIILIKFLVRTKR